MAEQAELHNLTPSHRLYKMMDSKCNSLSVARGQPGTLFGGNGSHPLSPSLCHLLFTAGGSNWTGLKPVLYSFTGSLSGSGYIIILELGARPGSHFRS